MYLSREHAAPAAVSFVLKGFMPGRLAKRYVGVFRLSFGPKQFVIVSDAAAAKQVCLEQSLCIRCVKEALEAHLLMGQLKSRISACLTNVL